MPKTNDVKKYDLKPIELQMIAVINDQHRNTLFNLLSFIAIDRLSIEITENTRFAVDETGQLSTWEEEPPREADSDTAKAMKG